MLLAQFEGLLKGETTSSWTVRLYTSYASERFPQWMIQNLLLVHQSTTSTSPRNEDVYDELMKNHCWRLEDFYVTEMFGWNLQFRFVNREVQTTYFNKFICCISIKTKSYYLRRYIWCEDTNKCTIFDIWDMISMKKISIIYTADMRTTKCMKNF